MEAKEEGTGIQGNLSGFIFMCNRITKSECYRYRVFGLPAGRKKVVEKINPGTLLFLFDTDVKLLYGIYMATSTGRLRIEPLAFDQKFPAQVQFKIYKDCLPLPENYFKHVLQDNYQKGSNKFNPELNSRQVRSLIELFRPLYASPAAPTHPILTEPVNNVFHQIPRPPLSEAAILSRMSPTKAPRLLNYKHVNELKEPIGCAYPVNTVMPNSAASQSVPSRASWNHLYAPASALTQEGTCAAGIGGHHAWPLPGPQYSHQNVINPQPEFHSSLVYQSSGHMPSLQDSQHTHHNLVHPQPEFHSSLMTMGGSHTQPMQGPQYPYQNIQNLPPDLHFPVANPGHGHAHVSWGPQYTGNSYAQLLPYPQHSHQNAKNPQPEFDSSLVNMGNTNVMTQSHTSSSLYYPYVPQKVVSSTYSSQGSGAIQGVIEQGVMGNEYYQPSIQNTSTQENVVSHLYPANSYSQC